MFKKLRYALLGLLLLTGVAVASSPLSNIALYVDTLANLPSKVPQGQAVAIVTDHNYGVYYFDGTQWNASGSGGGSGTVTASSPLAATTSGSATNITITSPLPVANGGLGLSAATSANSFLESTGTGYTGVTSIPLFAGGTGQVSPIVFNNSGSAGANTTTIQSALSAGGLVTINCPAATPIFYINASLVIGSRTKLVLNRCQPTLAASTNAPLLINYAYTQPWTYLNGGSANITWHTNPTSGYTMQNLGAKLNWPNHPLNAGDWVQIGFVGDQPAWAKSTTYSVGIKAVANSNIYTVATAGVSAVSGTGPSGTGSGISDGSAIWNYVSGASGITGYYWSGTQSAGAQGGIADTAYSGVFYVQSVFDANNVEIVLRRLPALAFSGIPIIVRKADHDIELNGGNTVFNYDGANQTASTTATKVCMMFSGIARTHLANFSNENCAKWSMGIEGAASLDIDHYDTSPEMAYYAGNTNEALMYGCFDCSFSYIRGTGLDDNIALQTSEGEEATHSDELVWSGGDIIGVHLDHIENVGGFSAASIWMLHTAFLIDDVTLDHVASHSMTNLGSAAPIIKINVINTTPAAMPSQPGVFGTIKISNSSMRDDNQAAIAFFGSNQNLTINNLIMDNISVGSNSTTGQWINITSPSAYTTTINNLSIINSNSNLKSASGSSIAAGCTSGCGTVIVNNLTLANSNILGGTTSANNVIGTSGVSVSNFVNTNIENNIITNAVVYNVNNTQNNSKVSLRGNTILGSTTTAYLVIDKHGLQASFINNNIPAGVAALVDTSTNDNVYLSGNYAPSNTGGVIRFEANATSIVSSAGGNVLGSTWFANGSGTGTETAYGWDIRCDVTSLTRTTGEFCFNTNAAPGSGTLTTIGPVMDQGTTSGSWFALYSPLTQTY